MMSSRRCACGDAFAVMVTVMFSPADEASDRTFLDEASEAMHRRAEKGSTRRCGAARD